MAIKISGTTVIDDNRNLTNVNIDDGVRKPTITSPTNGSTGVGGGAQFTAVTTNNYGSIYSLDQAGMQVQIDNNSDFSSPALDTLTATASTSYSFDTGVELSTNTLYYLRIRHYDVENNYSEWSDTVSFTTATSFLSVNDPTITSPASGATDQSTSQVVTSSAFASTPSGDTHASSDWQVASDSSFSNIVDSSYNDTSNLTSYTVNGSLNTTYYVRVRYNGTTHGSSDYSSAISFTTIATPPVGEVSYTSPGTYTFTPPAGVTTVHAVAIGGGTATTGENGGGGLGWKNDIAVSSASSYTVKVGSVNDETYFVNTSTAWGEGGNWNGSGGGGRWAGDNGGNGGNGGRDGGGAGGYTGNGGNMNGAPQSGSGGGAGGQNGGGSSGAGYAGGGGVGLFGKGADGVQRGGGYGGGGGSGGNNGGSYYNYPGSSDGRYGGGGYYSSRGSGSGGLRIIWGPNRSFPVNAS